MGKGVLEAIAANVGTPSYVYRRGSYPRTVRRADRALDGVPHRVHYSVKANGNLAILRLLRELGAGVDIVSGAASCTACCGRGSPAPTSVFSGVGKNEREMRDAVLAGVLLVNLEWPMSSTG